MKLSLSLALVAAAIANAHYTFPGLITNGQVSDDWEYVRETANHYSHGPVTDVTSIDLRCYLLDGRPASNISTVAAGSTVGFRVDPYVEHPGPLMFYMAKVPSGQTAATWDGSGTAWFKIYEEAPTVTSAGLQWASDSLTQVSVKIPSSLPSGDYLLRVEHIALHAASTVGGAQFYLACGQITVTGGGSGNPTPLVAIPGLYSATDPGILINLYYPIPTSYVIPGPAVWTG